MIFLKFPNFTRKQLCRRLFLVKLQVWRSANLLKQDSSTGDFLWILLNFWEHLFCRTCVKWRGLILMRQWEIYWLYIIFTAHTRFRVNLHSTTVTWISRNSLFETGATSEVYVSTTAFQPHSHLVCKQILNYLARLSIWLNAWVFVYKLSGCGFESLSYHLEKYILRNTASNCQQHFERIACLISNVSIQAQLIA